MTTRKPFVICDFDGTITMNDNIINIMKTFAPPEWVALKDGVLSKTLLIKEGVGRMFGLLPSRLKEEITSFVLEDAKIREGFREFVAFINEHEIPFWIYKEVHSTAYDIKRNLVLIDKCYKFPKAFPDFCIFQYKTCNLFF